MSDKKQLIIITYRENFEHTCSHGSSCNVYDSADSFFEIKLKESIEDAADYIAHHLFEYPKVSFLHLILEKWEDLVYSSGINDAVGYGVSSIAVAGDRYESEIKDALHKELFDLTKIKLENLEKEKNDREAIKNKKEIEKRIKIREEEELKIFMELKKKYEKG